MMIRNALRCLILLVLMLCPFFAWAQHKISGNIKDKAGLPIIGATVQVKGTSTGTITDLDGNYIIEVPDDAQTLVFSYVGYRTQEKEAKGKTIDIILLEDTEQLEEVVVIGYGTVQKKDLTGSVSSVSAKQLEDIPVANVSEALTGKLPGVSIVTTEGAPDADVKIRVRGGGSLSQDNSPLYIVDGFEVSSISDISPAEIQSIDVLKDASSTAIYGAKGANGVIIITTKSGHEGKPQVTLGVSYGLKRVTKLVKTLSPFDYVMYQYELGGTGYGDFADVDIWKSVEGTDYQDEIFGRLGNQQQYNVNVSGGTKNTKYSVTYARNDEKSIMLGSGFSKNNINAKLNMDINKSLRLDFNARLSYSTLDGISGGADTNESNAANSIVANSVRFRPITPLTEDMEDDEASSSRKYTPLERLEATYKQKRELNQNYNAGLSWKIINGLTARTEVGYGWRYTDTDQVWGTAATQNSKFGYSGQPQAMLTKARRTTLRNANTLTYDNKKLFDGRDRLNVLVGHEISSNQTNTQESTSVAFLSSMTTDEILAAMGNGTALPNQTNIGAQENMLSFFGRANYTLMDRYLFTFTMRADASSKFAKGNRWGYFPSAAFAWRMSEESFMDGTEDWLSNMKFRLSYGSAGNNRISSGLMYTTYSLAGNDGRVPFFDEKYTNMLEHGKLLSNPNLKWETTITRNFGIDYGFWNGRLSGAVDLYWNTTKDLLMQTQIPSNTGYSYQFQNFGQTSNKGVEFVMTAVIVDTKNFGLDFNFNLSYNYSLIDKLNLENPWQSSNWAGSTIAKYEDFKIEEGGRLGEVWGYRTNGFFTVYDPETNPMGELVYADGKWGLREGLVDNSPTITGGQYYPGGLKLKCDENGAPVKERLGNTIAPIYGGFGLNARLKNFDLSAFFNYSVGNVIINGTKLASSFYVGSSRGYNLNNDFAVGNRYAWIDPETGLNLGRGLSQNTINQYGGIENVYARLNEMNAGVTMYNPASATNMQLTDYAVEDASFLRINNVTFGYSLPKSVMTRLHMQTLRFYVTGYNLLCITKYSGSDPEVDVSSKKNPMTPGVDYASYPKSRSFVLGVNVVF